MNKIRSILLSMLCVLCASARVNAQSPVPGPETTNAPTLTTPFFGSLPISLDVLTNIPAASSFPAAKFGFDAGAIVSSQGAENSLKGSAYIRTNWDFSLEVLNAPSSTTVDGMSLYGGYRWAWTAAEVYTQVGIRKTWTGEGRGLQGVGLLGVAWLPITSTKLFPIVGFEGRVMTSQTGPILQTRPNNEFDFFMGGRF